MPKRQLKGELQEKVFMEAPLEPGLDVPEGPVLRLIKAVSAPTG